MTTRLFLFIIVSLAFSHCTYKPSDRRLSKVEQLASYSPKEGLDSLGAICYDSLSDEDKEYYDFLLVKTKDKAFIPHTSDSLILDVIENERKHRNRGRYSEALYYGGRVYHDLGDFPTALSYYQNALDNIDKDESKIELKGRVLSQIGGLLNSLRLYDQAIPYVKKVITLDSIRKDSINLIYSLELLGSINIHNKNFKLAERLFKRAKSIAIGISPTDTVRHNMYLAAIKYNQNQIIPALNLIRPTLLNIDSISRNIALAYACDIYRRANIPDTALMYAYELICSKDARNRKTGYQIILSDDLKGYTPSDSIIRFIYDYRDITESYLNQNGDQAALIQNSFYNYQIHQRERIKVESDNDNLKNWIAGILLIVLLLSICILYLKNRNKTHLLQLHKAINNVNTLRQILSKSQPTNIDLSNDIHPQTINSITSPNSSSSNIKDLRSHLREELLSLRHTQNNSYIVPPIILESEVYEKFIDNINRNKNISENSPLWSKLEEIVLKSSPDFKHSLNLLTGGKLKAVDLHTALLIKCGISSTDMSIIVGRAKSTIVYRKDSLGFKVFDKKLEAGAIDDIIRLL